MKSRLPLQQRQIQTKAKMNTKLPRDWGKTWLHFFCGIIAGGGVGAYAFDDWLYVIITAFGVGILAAIFLDEFWQRFLGGWGW